MSELTVGSLFSGYGGLDMAVEAVLGARTVWHCENNPDAARILAHHHPDTPNLNDISAVDWSKGQPVDVLCGGFPCQDISSAGRGAGIKEGTRSGLWHRYADAVRVLRPSLVVVENVGALLVRGLGIVAGDLAALGYVGSWVSVRASDVGAPHRRERVFIVAVDADQRGRIGWRASDPTDTGDGREGRVGGSTGTGADLVALLPTPVRGDGERQSLTYGGGNDTLLGALLPTPRTSDTNGTGEHGTGGPDLRTAVSLLPDDPNRWGQYAPAIARWEHLLGRSAPRPTDERNRLSPPFPEWMMGLPAGWVTSPGIGLSRSAQLRAIGNGVVPQQAAHGLRLLLAIREREAVS